MRVFDKEYFPSSNVSSQKKMPVNLLTVVLPPKKWYEAKNQR